MNILHSRTHALLLLTAISASLASACFQTKQSNRVINNTGTGSGSVAGASGGRIKVSSLLFSGTANAVMTLYVDAVNTNVSVNTVCDPASQPCSCTLSWTDTNSGQSVPRSVSTAVTNATAYSAACTTPAGYAEISNGTTVVASISKGSGNSNTFTVTGYSFVKSNTTGISNGNFLDAQGRSFHNILRYSCYEQYRRGMSVRSRVAIASNNQTGESLIYPFASKFCVQKAAGGSTVDPNECPGGSSLDYSAQAYYYNFFIRDSEKGGINASNDRYTCPRVIETLSYDGTTPTQNNYFPLDTQFALSLTPSTDFAVGVPAFTKVSKAGDPTSVNTSCSGGVVGGATDNKSFIQSCIGFAAKPNADGTCPTYLDSSGTPQPLYRLRKYLALYPAIYDTDGRALNQTQATDTIYVLDRPVTGGSTDPLRPYTMRGPKPCPFAFFDKKGVTRYASEVGDLEDDSTGPNASYIDASGYTPTYMGTYSSRWTGRNVDGIQFPKKDSVNSCAAVIPLLNSDRTNFSLATVHASNPIYSELHVRPIRAWAPHYEEDTEFLACAPRSSVFKDPPLHFAKAQGGNVSYCAEAYPTRNPNIAALDVRTDVTNPTSAFVGKVKNFTSHVVKNSTSTSCAAPRPRYALTFPTGYGMGSSAGCAIHTRAATAMPWPGSQLRPAIPRSPVGTVNYARQPDDLAIDFKSSASTLANDVFYCANEVCDRTVNTTTGAGWTRYPLLAEAPEVEDAIIANNSNYDCSITYDDGTKTDLATPTGGCCGAATNVVTGAIPANTPNHPATAHLEPGAGGVSACATPTY